MVDDTRGRCANRRSETPLAVAACFPLLKILVYKPVLFLRHDRGSVSQSRHGISVIELKGRSALNRFVRHVFCGSAEQLNMARLDASERIPTFPGSAQF
jgi:hypothetical protein